MRSVHQQNVHLIYLSKSLSIDHSMSSRSVSPFTFCIQHLLLRWVLSFADPFVLSLSLHHINVLLSALSHTMSLLPTVVQWSLKTFALTFALQSVKIGLIIVKCLSCLIVIVMLSKARVHWFDIIWVTLRALRRTR